MLGLTAAALAENAGINHTTLMISNHDMQDILKIVKSLEESRILIDRNRWN